MLREREHYGNVERQILSLSKTPGSGNRKLNKAAAKSSCSGKPMQIHSRSPAKVTDQHVVSESEIVILP
jgi:hypothetical protein